MNLNYKVSDNINPLKTQLLKISSYFIKSIPEHQI
jgi:hypothetical protein